MSEEKVHSIDRAIEESKLTITRHARANMYIIMGVLLTLVGVFAFFNFAYSDSKLSYVSKIKELDLRYRSAKNYAATLYKVLPDSLRLKEYTDTTILDDVVAAEPEKSLGNSSFNEYGIYLFGIVIISILIALYRVHLKEISKAEQNLIAFYRIRIAANNIKKEGFGSEVRAALTEGAFYQNSESNSSLFGSGKKVESPIPGHPTSDLLTSVLNKILENVEIKPKGS